jgi:GDP-L-fucose synthase
MKLTDKILILGAGGMVGSALVRNLKKQGYENILAPRRAELNLLDQNSTLDYFMANKPQHVVLAAAKVGGIHANNVYRADFIFENLTIQNNTFNAAFKADVDSFLFLGSSCIYPKLAPQPISEDSLLTSELEPTNEPYAIAKIAGLKTAESFRRQYNKKYFSVMPTNLYGEGDNFHPEHSHVIPGLINRMAETIKNGDKTFEVWGTGKPMREFLYVDDLAEACIFLLKHEEELPYWINVGTGTDITIGELAKTIADEMGFEGDIVFNTKYPDGTPRKLLDVSKVQNLGWKHKIDLKEGISKTVKYFREADSVRRV